MKSIKYMLGERTLGRINYQLDIDNEQLPSAFNGYWRVTHRAYELSTILHDNLTSAAKELT